MPSSVPNDEPVMQIDPQPYKNESTTEDQASKRDESFLHTGEDVLPFQEVEPPSSLTYPPLFDHKEPNNEKKKQHDNDSKHSTFEHSKLQSIFTTTAFSHQEYLYHGRTIHSEREWTVFFINHLSVSLMDTLPRLLDAYVGPKVVLHLYTKPLDALRQLLVEQFKDIFSLPQEHALDRYKLAKQVILDFYHRYHRAERFATCLSLTSDTKTRMRLVQIVTEFEKKCIDYDGNDWMSSPLKMECDTVTMLLSLAAQKSNHDHQTAQLCIDYLSVLAPKKQDESVLMPVEATIHGVNDSKKKNKGSVNGDSAKPSLVGGAPVEYQTNVIRGKIVPTNTLSESAFSASLMRSLAKRRRS
jgi:hypothetical protein